MKDFKSFLKESAITPDDVARKIVSILDNNFPNTIRVQHDGNLLTLSFDVVGPVTKGQLVRSDDPSNKTRSIAKKLASQILSSLKTMIKLEDSSIDSSERDAYVSLFMVSDSFVGMPDLKRPSGVKLVNERCWDGYKPTPGKKPYEKGSCMKEDDELQEEAEHEGKKVTLNKPFRTPDGPKKFAVYVKNDKGNVVKVTFGDPNMEIKRDSDDRKANFRARHNCDDPGPKDKARYWSCKMWSNTPVSKLAESEYIDSIQKIKESVIAEGYDFQELSGPKTKKVVGGIAGAPGNSPEDAIKQRMISFGYRNISITLKDGVYSVKAQWGADPKDAYNSYYRLQESLQADVSSAAKLFQKFLRSTGAPDKVASFEPKSVGSSTVYVGKSTNSKFDYSVDVKRGTVTATPLSSHGRQNKYVWHDKSGQVKMAESVLSEESPPDADIEKWIKDNKESFKQKYGSDKGLEVLYATAWSMYSKK
jgi:hypothetical protein